MTRDKLPPGNYLISPKNLLETCIESHTERARGIRTSLSFKKKTQTEDNWFHMNYQLNISTIAGTASTGTKPSNSTSQTHKNFCLQASEDYKEETPQPTNQDHLISPHPFNLSVNHFRPAQFLEKESIAYSKGQHLTSHSNHRQSQQSHLSHNP